MSMSVSFFDEVGRLSVRVNFSLASRSFLPLPHLISLINMYSLSSIARSVAETAS